jgi:alpha-1,2-mannosyltransferase
METLHLWPSIALFNFLNSRMSLQKTEVITSARIVYPPCDTREMSEFSLDNRERVILSVAQFR